MGEKTQASTATVRAWAVKNGFQVGQRGHLPKAAVEAFNRRHRKQGFSNPNPWLGSNRSTETAEVQ